MSIKRKKTSRKNNKIEQTKNTNIANTKNTNIANTKNQKVTDTKKIGTIKYEKYRERKIAKVGIMTNADRQKSYEQKQQKDGLKKVSFWLSNEDLKVIEREQKIYHSVEKIKTNRSKVLSYILRRFSRKNQV